MNDDIFQIYNNNSKLYCEMNSFSYLNDEKVIYFLIDYENTDDKINNCDVFIVLHVDFQLIYNIDHEKMLNFIKKYEQRE